MARPTTKSVTPQRRSENHSSPATRDSDQLPTRPRPKDWHKALSLVSSPRDRVIVRHKRTEILLVIWTADSRKRRSRAYLITWWHRRHLRYGSKLHDVDYTGADIDYHVFLARQDEMGVGALLAGCASSKPTWLKWNPPGSKRPYRPAKGAPKRRPLWKFAFIGVLATRRKRGIARLLLDAAAKRFGVVVCECGWGLPFQPDGEALVRRLLPAWFLVGINRKSDERRLRC